MSCVEIHALLRLLRLRGILHEFFSYVENNAFLRFLHLRGILRFLDPPTSGLRPAWEHTTQHFFVFFVCVEFFASSSLTGKTTHYFEFFISEEFFDLLTPMTPALWPAFA